MLCNCYKVGFHTGFFLVGAGKMMGVEPRPPRGVWGHALRLLLVASGPPKMLKASHE